MLEKLKDIFYDKNDIIVALVLVIIGGVIISGQVDSIMSYPEHLAEQLQQEQQLQEDLESAAKPDEEVETQVPESEPPAEEPPVEQPPVEQPPVEQTPSTSEFKTAVDCVVEIPSGSHSQSIAQILRDAGVIPSTEAFLDMVSEKKLDTKLKAGVFNIPAGSNLEAVVTIVTR